MRSVLFALLVGGCGAAAADAPARPDLSSAIRAWDEAAAEETASRVVQRSPPASRSAARGDRSTRAWQPRGRPVDVRFHRAPLSSALRLLAEAADLSIVIDEGLDREITADLRRVDPVEAMRALAQAHQIELSVVGRTVIARSR